MDNPFEELHFSVFTVTEVLKIYDLFYLTLQSFCVIIVRLQYGLSIYNLYFGLDEIFKTTAKLKKGVSSYSHTLRQ